MGAIVGVVAKYQQRKKRKEQERKFEERFIKTQIHPVIVRDKEELATAIYEKEKVIYITGDYYKAINNRYKKVINKANLSEDDIEKLKKEKKEAEIEKERNRKEFSQRSTMHYVIELVGTILETGISIASLPIVIIVTLFGFTDDKVRQEINHYKIKKNKEQERLELIKISGENSFNKKKEYV